MTNTTIHTVQAAILYILRHATRARYGELRRPTGLESDVFKYHLKKLMALHYVVKADDGQYELTVAGKEFSNRLNEKTGKPIEQPKSSMLIVVVCVEAGVTYYLAHQRMREPFRGFWGIASAPLLRGIPAQESAARELRKQAGIEADFEVTGIYRVIDKNHRGDVLEDKLFSAMYARLDGKVDPRPWAGGVSVWMTRDELLSQAQLFPITEQVFDMIDGRVTFREAICVYRDDEY